MARIAKETTVPTPRKRAPLRAVPDPKLEGKQPSGNGKGAASSVAKFKASGRKVGKNRQNIMDQQVLNSGPDMPPGKALSWLPKPEEVPPKPTTKPEMEWPGPPHFHAGHPEWQLYSEMAADAKERDARGEPYVLFREWRIRWVPPDGYRCKARSIGKYAAWMGNRCTMKAIRGGTVCTTHGGKLGTVRKAAQATLARAALPAAEQLVHIALTKRGVADTDRIKALVQILDRAGVAGRQTIELEVRPWQEVLERVYTDVTGQPVDAEEVEGLDYELEEEGEPYDDEGED
jgi:hypothetical protein